MGEQLRFKSQSGGFDGRQWMDLGREAQKEIDRLLELRPEFKGFQAEIDDRPEADGHTENRLAVLSQMMEAKIKELEDHRVLSAVA